MEKNSILREAGTLERIYNANHFSGFYPCFCLSAQYKLPNGLQGSPHDWERMVRSAVSSFVLNHGALCCGVVGEDGQHPTFVRLDTLDLERLVEFSTVNGSDDLEYALEKVLEDLHSQKWTHLHETPGWKLVLLGHADQTDRVFVILVAHHAFMDGQGGMVSHREVFRALTQDDALCTLESTLEVSVIEVPSVVKLYPPVEELMKVPTTWDFQIHNLWSTMCPSWLGNWFSQPSEWTGNPITKECISNYRTRTHIYQIGTSDLENILTECKSQHTTPTSLVHAVAVVLLTKLVSAHSFLGHTPYTLRKWTGSDALRDIVNQTSDTSCIYQHSWLTAIIKCNGNKKDESAVLWEIARFHRAELTRELSQVPINNGLATLGRYTDRHMANMRLVGKVRPLTFEVSNLGLINLERCEGDLGPPNKPSVPFQPPWGHIDISQLTFTQSAMVSSAPLTLSVVSMSDGLAISTSWQPEALDEAVAKGFCRGLSDWLKYLGHGK